MSRQGNGVYVLPAGNPVVPDTDITATWANTTLTDIAQALTGSLAADGQTAALGNMPMGGFRHTGVGLPDALTQYSRTDQVQQSTLLLLTGTAAASANTYSGTLPLGATTFTQWQLVFFPCPATNTGPATLNINASGPKAIVQSDGSVISANDMVAGVLYGFTWDGTSWRFINASSDFATLDARYVQLSGGVMTGALQVPTPVSNNDAAPKIYVDTGLSAKLDLSGGTLTGSLTLAGDPVADLQAATRQWVIAQIATTVVGVASFNTRTGAVTLTSGDVTGALTFTPYPNTNPDGFITGITGAQVNAALGFVPYNSAGGTISGDVVLTGNITGGRFSQTQFTGTLGLTGAIDFNQGQVQVLTLTDVTATITAINNLPVGSSMRIALRNPSASGVSIFWPSTFWNVAVGNPSNVATLTTTVVSLTRVSATGIVGDHFTTTITPV